MSKGGGVGVEAEEDATGRFVVVLAGLDLLGNGVHVAEAPLEGTALEDRGRPGELVDAVGHGGGAVDGVGPGEAVVSVPAASVAGVVEPESLSSLPQAASRPAPATAAVPMMRPRRDTMLNPTSLGLGDCS